MLTYLIRRLLLIPVTLIGITALVFFVLASAPGGIGASLLSNEGSMRPAERQARREYLNRRYGLDKPYVIQYLKWLNNVSPVGLKEREGGFPASWKFGFKEPDLGNSFTRNRKVSAIISEALPVSLLLQVIALPIAYSVAIVAGVYAARHRGKALDHSLGFVSIALFSIPVIWLGVLFIGFLCNRDYVQWFPANGMHDVRADTFRFLPHFDNGFHRGWFVDLLWHLVGPVLCLTVGQFAVLSKLMRGALLDTLSLDFIRTARAKGLPEQIILWRHAFRNSLIPLITVAASLLPALITGAVVIETMFGLPGMGKLVIDAIDSRDRELFLSNTLMISFLALIGYLLADIGYAIADPRVSYDN